MQNKEKIIGYFTSGGFKEFINQHKAIASDELLFYFSSHDDLKLRHFASQMVLYRKACHKLPTYVDKLCLFSSRSYEQASSELTAGYKASMVQGERLLDLSGGLGVDDWAFSQKFAEVDSVDTDEELNLVAQYNFEQLNRKNIKRITDSAEHYLHHSEKQYSLIYLDADRRSSGNKTFLLKDSSPDVMVLLPLIFKHSQRLLLKLSPLLDIGACLNQLPEVKRIEVVSVENEVKELILLLEKNFSGEPLVIATDLRESGIRHQFSMVYPGLSKAGSEYQLKEMVYFYEPGAALIKSGLSSAYSASLNQELFQTGVNSLYYLSGKNIPDFFGRSFQIIHSSIYNPKRVKAYCQVNAIQQANISRRNFPHSTDIIRKQLNLKDGGTEYFFFTNSGNELLFFHCRKTG